MNKVKKVKLNNFQFPPLDLQSNNETVYVHRLFSQVTETTGFSATSSFMKAEGKLRIYKPSEGVGWRNLTQIENITIKLLCSDPWVTSIFPDYKSCPDLAPGQIAGISFFFEVTL